MLIKNAKLSRIHWILTSAYAIAGVVLFAAFLGVDRLAALAFLFAPAPIALLHFAAMRGARRGTNWGRLLSRTIGVILLLGFPIGTLTGIYILMQTGKRWECGEAAKPAY